MSLRAALEVAEVELQIAQLRTRNSCFDLQVAAESLALDPARLAAFEKQLEQVEHALRVLRGAYFRACTRANQVATLRERANSLQGGSNAQLRRAG